MGVRARGTATHPAPLPDGPPLLWFGLFRRRAAILAASSSDGRYRFGEWQPALDFPTYDAALNRIKAAIARGDTYQANFTFPLRAAFHGDPLALFAALSAAQRAEYLSLIHI